MSRVILPLLLLLAACGQSSPTPPPVAKTPTNQPRTEADTSPDPAVADRKEQWAAQAALEQAKSEKEARAARSLYTGSTHAELLDHALNKKLSQLDFDAYSAAVNAIKATTTPAEAEQAAKAYAGERHIEDLKRELDLHIQALIEKTPSLGRVRKPSTGTLDDLFNDCLTESDAAAARAAYKGPATEQEIEAALEVWRWREPVVVDQASLTSRKRLDGRFHRFSDGNMLIPMDDGHIELLTPEGEVMRTFAGKPGVTLHLVGLSDDSEFLFTAGGTNPVVQKWSMRSGQLMGSFGSVNSALVVTQLSRLVPGRPEFVTCSNRGHLTLWNTDTGAFIRHLVSVPSVKSVEFSPDGSVVYVCSPDRVGAYDMATGRSIKRYPFNNGSASMLKLSRDGTRMGIYFRTKPAENTDGKWQDFFLVLDTSTGEELARLSMESMIHGIHWLASGKHILVETHSKLLLIDADTFEVIHQHAIEEHQYSAFMSPDGRTLTVNRNTFGRAGQAVPNSFTYGRMP